MVIGELFLMDGSQICFSLKVWGFKKEKASSLKDKCTYKKE
jgi:hypothetical protein